MEPAQQQTPAVPAGWHPDPQTPGHLRWWDGIGWTPHVRAASPPQAPFPVAGQQQAIAPQQAQTYDPATAAMMQRAERHESIVQENPKSFLAMAVSATYLVIALYTGVVLLGIVPGLFAFRAFERKEKLAPVAAVAAAIVIGFAITHLKSPSS